MLSWNLCVNFARYFLMPKVRDGDDYTEASDVWSFAFVMTEIFSFGKQPLEDWRQGKVYPLP